MMPDTVLRVRAPMPAARPVPPRPAGWWIVAAGLVLIMVCIAVQMVRDGAHPSGDRGAHWEGPWPYPTEAIETWLSVMAAECLVICTVLRGRGPESVGARALVLGLVMLFARIGLSPLGRHAGTPIPEHFTWMGLAAIWLVGCAIMAGLARRWRSHDASA
jgi:hypothetical protein